MLRQIPRLALVLMLAAQSGCGKASSDNPTGNWQIDMPTTLEQAQSLGASASDIDGIRRTFDGGRLTITPSTITLSLADTTTASTLEYHLESKAGECSILRMQGADAPHRYCVSGSQLKVHDPATPLVVVYRRI